MRARFACKPRASVAFFTPVHLKERAVSPALNSLEVFRFMLRYARFLSDHVILCLLFVSLATAQTTTPVPHFGVRSGEPRPIAPTQTLTPTPDNGVASHTTTAADRRSVNVTVYNSNLGLVRETRALTLPTGRTALRFADVAAQIRPETVHLGSLTAPTALSILEQNYQYDLLNPAKLMDKYVGREVTLVLRRMENGTEVFVPVQAVLLSNNQGQVWRINNQIVINPTNIVETRFPDLPQNLVATPTLVMDVNNETAGEHTIEASYLTAGMNWRSDYVLVINETDTRGDLQGWVTLTNESGVGFENARLQLIAGNVNRVESEDGLSRERRPTAGAMEAAAQQFAEQAFFEYHLYTLQRPASVRERETKQISLLEATGMTVNREYVINGGQERYRGEAEPGEPAREQVGVFVGFRNSQQNHLGMPLPAGTIRLYKRDSHGGGQFIGENRITHTPRDENIRLRVGDAFDIVAERRLTNYRLVSRSANGGTYEYAYEIAIRNHKDVPINVIVNEGIGGDWRIVSSSIEAERMSAFAARFRVPVAANNETRLTYRVRVRY